jgi:hypothetical protein
LVDAAGGGSAGAVVTREAGGVEGASEVSGESTGQVKAEGLACPVTGEGGMIGGAKEVVGWVELFP